MFLDGVNHVAHIVNHALLTRQGHLPEAGRSLLDRRTRGSHRSEANYSDLGVGVGGREQPVPLGVELDLLLRPDSANVHLELDPRGRFEVTKQALEEGPGLGGKIGGRHADRSTPLRATERCDTDNVPHSRDRTGRPPHCLPEQGQTGR